MPRKRERRSSRQVREILRLWETLHAGLEQAVGALPDEALGFRPKARARTLGQLVRHTLMAETYYFANLPAGSQRRPALAKEYKRTRALLSAMRRVHRWSVGKLKRLNDADLDETKRLTWLPRMSVRQILLYVIAHEVHHRAQVYTYIRLWEPRGRRYPRPWWVVRGRSSLVGE